MKAAPTSPNFLKIEPSVERPQPRPCQTSPSCLSHGGREQNIPCLLPLSVKCLKLLSLHGVRGPAPIKTSVKRPGEALPFHVEKGEGRSGGKQNPGRLQGCRCQRCLPRRTAMGGWGGSQHRLCISPSSLPALSGQKGRQDCVFSICGTHKQNKSLGRTGRMLPFLSPLLGLAPGSRDCNWLQALAGLHKQALPLPSLAPAEPPQLSPPHKSPWPRSGTCQWIKALCPPDGFTAFNQSPGGDAMCSPGMDGTPRISCGFCPGRWVRHNLNQLPFYSAFLFFPSLHRWRFAVNPHHGWVLGWPRLVSPLGLHGNISCSKLSGCWLEIIKTWAISQGRFGSH